jgi:hypothetical protein
LAASLALAIRTTEHIDKENVSKGRYARWNKPDKEGSHDLALRGRHALLRDFRSDGEFLLPKYLIFIQVDVFMQITLEVGDGLNFN